MEYVCRRVPLHLREHHWPALLSEHAAELTDQLVLHQSGVTRVLAKFERPQFIHTYVDAAAPTAAGSSGHGASGSRKRASSGKRKDASSASSREGPHRAMLFELPRFGLEFELRGGELLSLDYAGYRLRACQQLVVPGAAATGGGSGGAVPRYTLPDFFQYLVLEQAAGSSSGSSSAAGQRGWQKVLVPEGRVERRQADVCVQHATSSNAGVQVGGCRLALPCPWGAEQLQCVPPR